LCDGAQVANFYAIFWVLYFQRAACSTFQTCILNSHQDHIKYRSMVDIQSATAEIRRGKKEERRRNGNGNIMSASATQGGHKQPLHASNYIDSFIKYSGESYKSINRSISIRLITGMSERKPTMLNTTHTRSQIVTSMMFRSKSKQVCIKRFAGRRCHESLFHTHCCKTLHISKFQEHYEPGPL